MLAYVPKFVGDDSEMKYEESHVFSISQENMEVSFCDSDEKGSLYSHGLVKK